MRGQALAACLVLASGCANRDPYPCASSDQCANGAVAGVCEATGFCSFPDTGCPSGRRYDPYTGAGLGGTCVSPCGILGAACCPSAPACGGNTFCNNGTCETCVTGVAPGRRFTCAVKHDGTVWCSGENAQGQLGRAAVGSPSATPMQVRDGAGPIMDATAVGAGREHACAVRTSGTVWCWGLNSKGQLGDGSTALSALAVQVITSGGMPLTGIVGVDGGDAFTCALDATGGVSCWGDNGNGELGDGTVMPRSRAEAAVGISGAVEMTIGGYHSCVRKTGGEVLCWGDNTKGEVGDNTGVDKPTPVQVITASSVAAGRYHTCAVKTDGSVWCWGQDLHARLGNGNTAFGGAPVLQPAQTALTGLGGTPFGGAASVAAGASTCVMMPDHGAYCWGAAAYGQTGTGAGAPYPAPVINGDDTPLAGIDHLIAHNTRTCAFMTDGRLLCFGRNTEGELGDGEFSNRGVPTPLELSCP